MACVLVPSQSQITSNRETDLVTTTPILDSSAASSVAKATGQARCDSVGIRIQGLESGRRCRNVILHAQALALVGERIVGASSAVSGFRRFLPLADSVTTHALVVFAYLSVSLH